MPVHLLQTGQTLLNYKKITLNAPQLSPLSSFLSSLSSLLSPLSCDGEERGRGQQGAQEGVQIGRKERELNREEMERETREGEGREVVKKFLTEREGEKGEKR